MCTLNAGAIIGDITVLASVKRRTASVIATSELLAFRIRRSVFLRRLPADQLEVRAALLLAQSSQYPCVRALRFFGSSLWPGVLRRLATKEFKSAADL